MLDVCLGGRAINSYPAQCAVVMKRTSHMSATAALPCKKTCSESVKTIALHQPSRFPPMRACDAEGSRGESIFAKHAVTRDLGPVGEGRLIEAILIVEMRNDVIATLDHLARRFSKA